MFHSAWPSVGPALARTLGRKFTGQACSRLSLAPAVPNECRVGFTTVVLEAEQERPRFGRAANSPHPKSAVGRPSAGGLLAACCSPRRFGQSRVCWLRSRPARKAETKTWVKAVTPSKFVATGGRGRCFWQAVQRRRSAALTVWTVQPRRSAAGSASADALGRAPLTLVGRAAATERRPHLLDRGPCGPCSRAGARPAAQPGSLRAGSTRAQADHLPPTRSASVRRRAAAALRPNPLLKARPNSRPARPVVHSRPVPAVCRPRLSSNVRPVKCECQSANH